MGRSRRPWRVCSMGAETMTEFVKLHDATKDVQATFDWLLRAGYRVGETRGGTGMGQHVELLDSRTRIWITRDRGQWMLDVQPAGWSEAAQLSQLLAAMRLEHLPTDGLEGSLRAQLPAGEVWAERLPEVLEWSVDQPHRSVFVGVERQRYGTRNFGGQGRAPSLGQIERWVDGLAEVVGAPPSYLPTYGSSEDFARPHIEVSRKRMAFVVVERGRELERQEFVEAVELLEHIFRGVAFNMAVDWEVDHRDEAEDFRRRLWAKQLVLLDRLHPRWAEQLASLHAAKFGEVGLDPIAASDIVTEAGGASE